MAYFDSSKNRALWEIELQSLRKARADRAVGKESDIIQRREAKQRTGREPIRMTYKELLKEEAAATQKAPRRERSGLEAGMRERQKEGRAYEKV